MLRRRWWPLSSRNGAAPVLAAGERTDLQIISATLREFATTLLLAVVTPEWVAAVQVGDGAVVVEDGAGDLRTLTTPEHGEYLNETAFITSSDYLARAQYAVWRHDGLRSVALLTDGLELLALDLARNVPHAPFFRPLFAFAAAPDSTEEELAAFLRSERVCARTDDDKTLVLAVRV